MYKAFVFLFFVVLFSCSSDQAIGQVTANESRPSNETNTIAKRLLQEGVELTGAGQLPQAVSALEEAIKLDPYYADAYSALGRAYFKMREWRRAVENLRRATALNAKPRPAENASQQQSAATNLNANAVQTQLEQKIAAPKDSALVRPQLSQEKQDINSDASVFNSPTVEENVATPAPPTPQIETTGSTPQPEKRTAAAIMLSATPSGQTANSESRDVKTQSVESQVRKRVVLEPVGQTGERSTAPQSATLAASTQLQKVQDSNTTGVHLYQSGNGINCCRGDAANFTWSYTR